jgi:hypothetical protein
VKIRSKTRHDFYVENPCGKKHGRQWVIFNIMRKLQRMEYNKPACSSHTAYKMYMWRTKLTVVNYENKFVKHIT